MSLFFRSGDDINGTSKGQKKKKFENLNKFSLGLIIVSLILIIGNFIPYVIYHTWPVDETSEIDRFNANAPWALIIFGCYLSPMGMIIGAAMLLVWCFLDGHILILFCFRKWVYLVSFPIMLAGAICLCIFTPAWIWAVLFAPLGFCIVVSFLGCWGKFRTERVDNDGKIITLKRISEWNQKQDDNEAYEDLENTTESLSFAEQKRHNLEMERIAKQQLSLEKSRERESKKKIDYAKCLTCAKCETCGRITCHYIPKRKN